MKESLYKTAKARVSCAAFKAGEFVALSFEFKHPKTGVVWYRITATERGPLAFDVMYPAQHLEGFTL